MSRRGTTLALDGCRRDALAAYARMAAHDVGQPLQTWVRETWNLKTYEAKHLIEGNASEVVWERLLKKRGPHCGWALLIPIMGSVIGHDIADHFANEKVQVANERAAFAAEEARLATLEAHARERRAFAGLAPRESALPSRNANGGTRVAAPRVGGERPN